MSDIKIPFTSISGDPVAMWPFGALVALQVVFYSLLAFILVYLMSHWIFHAWSFINIVQLAQSLKRKRPHSLSYKWMPILTIFIFLLYTAYVGAFVWMSVVLLQFKKYFRFARFVSETQRDTMIVLMYFFFAMSLYPVLINMIAAVIKLTYDAIYSRKVEKKFKADTHQQNADIESVSINPPIEDTSLYHDNVGQSRDIHHNLRDMNSKQSIPLVYLFIPVYNEPLPNLIGALNGIAAQDYPRLRCVVGFDNYHVEETFFTLARILAGVPILPYSPNLKNFDHLDILPEPKVAAQRRIRKEKYNGLHQIAFDTTATDAWSSTNTALSRSGTPVSAGPSNFSRSTEQLDSTLDTYHASVTSNELGQYEELLLKFSSDACPEEFDVTYRNMPFTLHRFEHGGKLATQRKMFERLKDRLHSDPSRDQNPLILFMDSDTAILPNAISQLVGELERYPESKACTGFVVSRNEGTYSFWRILQDAEYIESMIFRNAESLMGSVTCLPGVLTMFRWKTLCEVAKEYFYQSEITSTYDFCRRYLGEDRYLTHILMEMSGWHALGFNSKAVCKTEAPSNFMNLLRQRRRWFLGTISNEVIMLCTPGLWLKFPLLLSTKLLQLLKIGGAFTYILFVEILFNLIFDSSNIDFSLIAWLSLIILPNWLFITIWCLAEKRIKGVFAFPIYYWFNPLFTIIILLYSFATVRQRTWGGPRANAAKTEQDEESGESQ